MMKGFLADNPDCAAKLARHWVAEMRGMGFEDGEIREFLEHTNRDGLLSEEVIQTILET